MTKNTKIVAIFAVFLTLLVGMIPANIAWAGPLTQGGTLPTAITHTVTKNSPISTPIQTATISFKTTTAPQKTTSISSTTSTLTPSPSLTATTNSSKTATIGIQVKTESATPSSTLTLSPSPTVNTATSEPAVLTATETVQTGSDLLPVITNDKTSEEAPEGNSTLPVAAVVVGGILLLIVAGAIIRRIIFSNRKSG